MWLYDWNLFSRSQKKVSKKKTDPAVFGGTPHSLFINTRSNAWQYGVEHNNGDSIIY